MKSETALVNGKIYSVDLNGNITRGTSIAIADGKILKIGNREDIDDTIDEQTNIIDCHGKTILPGLCDAHCHPAISAGLYAGCDLFGVYINERQTPDDVIDIYLQKLQSFIDNHPDYELYRGSGWVINNFPENRLPTRHDLDKICSDKPVILESFCIHYAWCNTKALELAGVCETTKDVIAGKIYREPDGYPTGLLSQPEAMNLVKLNVPGYDFSVDQYKDAFLYYQKEYANKYGVTLIHDCMHSDNAREAYIQLAQEGRLTVRLRGVYVLEPAFFKKQLPEFISRKGKDNIGNDFRIDTIKIFTEGEFVFEEPYEKSFLQANNLPADYNGHLYWSDEDLTSSISKAIKSGFNVHLHAMGDASVRQSAVCIANAQKISETKPRNIIAHLMLCDDDIAELMGTEEIIAQCMPRWMVYDSDIAGMAPQIGKERAENSYPFRKFIENGVIVAFGTDFPVTPPPDTMHEIHCAMNRSVFPDAPDYEKFKGKVLGTEAPATLSEAIKAISINGAYQTFCDDFTGSIEEGKSADLVILDADLENVPLDELYKINVLKTIFKGKTVYEKEVRR